ncbi:TRAP transporter small permease subunit [Pararhizobium mangrovi]|nr:TRAP transporter small permease [Pararhizobium mangrovi]
MARIGGIGLLGSAVLISIEVCLRSLGVGGLSVGAELASYALALGATWSLAYVVFERGHVRVDVVVMRLSPLWRSILDIVALASLAGVGFALSYGGLGVFETSLRLDAHSNTTLGMPLVLPQGAWLFGLCWFTLVAFVRTLQAATFLVRGDHSHIARIAGTPSADDEIEDVIHDTQGRMIGQE